MKKQEKKAYGELENVMLTDAEYDKLMLKFPSDYEDRINAVGYYIDATGKKYRSHYATILMWYSRDKKKEEARAKPKGTGFSNFNENKSDYALVEQRAIEKLMKKRCENGF